MAQERQFIGNVKGPKGDPGKDGANGTNGKDAVIATATAKSDASHLDQPTVEVTLGGEPGSQTFDFSFKGLMGPQGPKGDAGAPGAAGSAGKDGAAGKDGVSVTHEWEGTTLKVTSASGTTEADLVGPTGPAGPAGPAGPTGPAGKDGANATTTATATGSANGLMSSADKKKLDAITGGTSASVVLADGTTKTIASLLQEQVGTIRAALGVATKEHDGLMPRLPENPYAE